MTENKRCDCSHCTPVGCRCCTPERGSLGFAGRSDAAPVDPTPRPLAERLRKAGELGRDLNRRAGTGDDVERWIGTVSDCDGYFEGTVGIDPLTAIDLAAALDAYERLEAAARMSLDSWGRHSDGGPVGAWSTVSDALAALDDLRRSQAGKER